METGPRGGELLPFFISFSKAFSKWNLNKLNSNQKAKSTELNMLQHEMHQHVSIPMLDFIFNENYLFTNLNAHKNI